MYILFIEPDAVIAKNLKTYFSKYGHKVVCKNTAQASINEIDIKLPDIVVADLQLAKHSGIELMHELRSYPDWQDLPVVFYSSISLEDFGGEFVAKQLTISAYVHKSTSTLAQLLSIVESVVKHKAVSV